MKKITRLLLLAAISIGMVACSNDDVPQTPESLRGTTYASIAVALPGGPSTRASLDDTWDGVDAIESITVFMVNETKGTIDFTKFTAVNFNGISEGILKPNLAVKATPGEKVKAYVVVNGKGDILKNLTQKNTPNEFKEAYADAVGATASQLAENRKALDGTKDGVTKTDRDVIWMTNAVEPTAMAVEANVTEEQAINGTGNYVKVNVERLVSRAIVTTSANEFTVDGITIKDLKYSVGQSNKKFFWDKKESDVTPNPLYEFVPNALVDWTNNTYLDYSELAARSEVLVATNGTKLAGFQEQLVAEKGNSKFVLPVTHAKGDYRKGNTTYFEVVATFVPSPSSVVGTAYVPGNDIFLGMGDKKFYTTRTLATANGQEATMYRGTGTADDVTPGAITKYVLWLNPDKVPGAVADEKATMSPTVRNQVYHAHIKGFKSIGVPNNPLNPKDPNIEGNPINPIDPTHPLENNDTYLSVEITVLPWGIHSYEIDLGNDY